jgi:hypothetical protein
MRKRSTLLAKAVQAAVEFLEQRDELRKLGPDVESAARDYIRSALARGLATRGSNEVAPEHRGSVELIKSIHSRGPRALE